MSKVFTFVPSYSTSGDFQLNASTVQFGDGYKQSLQAGINNQRLKFSVGFTNRQAAEITAIQGFLMAHRGVIPFEWNPPPPYNWADSPLYVNGASYAVGSLVKIAGGSVYAAVQAVSNQTLTNADYWCHIGKVPLKFVCQSGNWQSSDFNKTGLTAVFEQAFE